jgi:hypothetical protein
MAKQRFSGALNAASFPLVSVLQNRTVVQPQLDSGTRQNQQFYGTPESAEQSIPRLLYGENVVPTAEGLQSVSYEDIIPALAGAIDFDQAITLRDTNENNFLFSPAQGKNYIYRANTGAWVSTNPITGANSKVVTRAYVNGRTIICYEGLGIYEYNSTTNTFNKLTFTGLTDSAVRGIASSNNYMIAYTDITVYWSSLIDPTDYTPSLTTGAGFSIPQDVKARISAVLGTAGGFIIYTAKNAVAAVYSQNIRAPFSFKEIANAGGVTTYEQITSDQNSGPQYAWTTGGLQKITVQGAETVSAEINDFLAGRMYETFDTSTKQLTTVYVGAAEFDVKVTYIGSRYLIVSYSVDNSGVYQYALVMDTVLKRWGKLKISHVDAFAYPYPNVNGDLAYSDLVTVAYGSMGSTSYAGLANGLASVVPSKKTIAFLLADGTTKLMSMDYNKIGIAPAVAIFGKFQLLRARMITLQTVDIEGTYPDVSGAPVVSATLLTSLDGKNLTTVNPLVLLEANTRVRRYAKRATGLNLAIAVEGSFSLSSYVLEVTAEGDR